MVHCWWTWVTGHVFIYSIWQDNIRNLAMKEFPLTRFFLVSLLGKILNDESPLKEYHIVEPNFVVVMVTKVRMNLAQFPFFCLLLFSVKILDITWLHYVVSHFWISLKWNWRDICKRNMRIFLLYILFSIYILHSVSALKGSRKSYVCLHP